MSRNVDPQALINSLKRQLADEATEKHMYAAMLADAEERIAQLETSED